MKIDAFGMAPSGHIDPFWSYRLLQFGCEGADIDSCRIESLHALLLLVGLCTTIVFILCAFAFFREDKEEQITPLCPQLMVHEASLEFTLPLDSKAEMMTIDDLSGKPMCKVAMDYPDPFRPGSSGVAATVRLQSIQDVTLATVVARNVAVLGQGLALCRAGCEIFGFVEPEGQNRYFVRHRTGVHLLTLCGDFDNMDVEGINPVGSKVCWFKQKGDSCQGQVLQHVDAGLVLCSLLATRVHRRLSAASVPPALSRDAFGVDAGPRSVDADAAQAPASETTSGSSPSPERQHADEELGLQASRDPPQQDAAPAA